MPVFLFQQTRIQGAESPYHSHSMVKIRNAEDALAGMKPSRGGPLRTLGCVTARSFGMTKPFSLKPNVEHAKTPPRVSAIRSEVP